MDGVQLKCLACGHAGDLDARRFRELRGEDFDMRSLTEYYDELVCSHCRSKRVRVESRSGKALLDPDTVVECMRCGLPIPLARLDAQPGVNTCVACAEDAVRPYTEAWPQPPNAFRKCPRCKSPTEVRQNTVDQSFFLGCKTWPRCPWTMPYETARKPI
jgi:hypothetical protein